MSSKYFKCHEHVVSCQYIRNYARATAIDEEDELHMAVKQYEAVYPDGPQPGDITIVACHACGFPKELYEPVWDQLYKYSVESGAFRIRNIFIADVANQGQSGVLNEGKLGNDISWFDYARDYLSMINQLRSKLTRPLIAFGHSMGGNVLTNVALMHPRLFASLIAIEPTINSNAEEMNFAGAYPIILKRDVWKTHAEAVATFRQMAFYKTWNPECLDLLLKHGLREVPGVGWTLKTSKHQEVLSYTRAAYPAKEEAAESFKPTRDTHPELLPQENAQIQPSNLFYRPEPIFVFNQMQHLRPSTMFMYGGTSTLQSAAPHNRELKMKITGTGAGGSGGAAEDAIGEVVYEEKGHFMVFEIPQQVGLDAAKWIAEELPKWKAREEAQRWETTPVEDRGRVDETWKYWVREQYGKKSGPKL